MNKIIDTHTHYSHKKFDNERDTILASLGDNGIVAVVEAAIGYESNLVMADLCRKWPFMYFTAGCHPNRISEMDEDKFLAITEILSHPKVVGIGETGLDYSRGKTTADIELQKKWFLHFVELSLHYKKPLVIHCRETKAYEDLIHLLSEFHLPDTPGIIHCYSSNITHFENLASKGFYFSIGGMFTKLSADHELCKALKEMPLDRILLETDCPFLTPEGIKDAGKHNTSLNIPFIVEKLARLRGESTDVIFDAALANTKKVFPGIVTNKPLL